MRSVSIVAQRAALPTRQLASRLRRAVPLVVATVLAAGAATVSAAPAAAGGPRVVIVVGPSGSATADYLSHANRYADLARSRGAAVTELYTPRATWARVRAAAQGANILIYLGHGNGWPSPYAPYQTRTKDGLGLNASDTSGNVTPTYYGEGPIGDQIRLAPGAVVLLNRLCYASGNGESGAPEPSWEVARQRVDNYAAGFLRAGAAAVLADGHTSLDRELGILLGNPANLLDAWRSDPDANGHVRAFASQRTPGHTTYLDPDRASSGFYRALTTKSWVSTWGVRIPAMTGVNPGALIVRGAPSTGAAARTTLAAGSTTWVTGNLVADSSGRTWAPIVTAGGQHGWVAAWLQQHGGSTVPVANLRVRSGPSTGHASIAVVPAGTRVAVLGTTARNGQTWLKVRTGSGTVGWMAAWYARR